MGKNKLKTYALSIVVLAIWGIIGYQIYSALNPSEEELEVPQMSVAFDKQTIKVRDTFSIQNEYRDPFLGKLPEKRITPTVQKTPRPQTADSLIFPDIQYKGMVENADGKETVFAVSINGMESILSAGQQYQEVLLVSGKQQQIIISYKGKRKTISK